MNWKEDIRPIFHVRFIENDVEQEQIFVGVPDGNGGFNLNVPTPCTLLSVKQHEFPYCDVCDAVPDRTLGVEKNPEAGINAPQSIEFPELPNVWPHACAYDFYDEAARIRAEVEAMEWPEVIGE